MKPPRLSLRINGARLGDSVRPVDALPAEPTAPARLPLKRVQPILSTRPNTYMPDDDEAAS